MCTIITRVFEYSNFLKNVRKIAIRRSFVEFNTLLFNNYPSFYRAVIAFSILEYRNCWCPKRPTIKWIELRTICNKKKKKMENGRDKNKCISWNWNSNLVRENRSIFSITGSSWHPYSVHSTQLDHFMAHRSHNVAFKLDMDMHICTNIFSNIISSYSYIIHIMHNAHIEHWIWIVNWIKCRTTIQWGSAE